jgi:hypothetical protein
MLTLDQVCAFLLGMAVVAVLWVGKTWLWWRDTLLLLRLSGSEQRPALDFVDKANSARRSYARTLKASLNSGGLLTVGIQVL